MKTNLIRLVLAVMVAVISVALEARSATQPPLWGADYFGNVTVVFGGVNGGETKILNATDPWQETRYFNYLVVRDQVSGQVSWIDVEFSTTNINKLHRLSGFFASQAPGVGWKIYRITSTAGITNLQLIGTSTGCGWPPTPGSRQLGISCLDDNFRYFDLYPYGMSVKIRFEYIAPDGIENNNAGKNLAAIDYLSFVKVPEEGDQIALTIDPINRQAPQFGNRGRFDEYPGSDTIWWAKSPETDIDLPFTLKPILTSTGIQGTWRPWDVDNIRTSPDGLFYILHLFTKTNPEEVDKGVFVELMRY